MYDIYDTLVKCNLCWHWSEDDFTNLKHNHEIVLVPGYCQINNVGSVVNPDIESDTILRIDQSTMRLALAKKPHFTSTASAFDPFFKKLESLLLLYLAHLRGPRAYVKI